MKSKIVFAFFCCCCSLICYSQEYGQVETKSGIYLYAIPSNTNIQFPLSSREVFDVSSLLKARLIKKSTPLKVVDYTNLHKSSLFDAYVVDFKGNLFFIQSTDVVDNALLDKRNRDLLMEYERLIDSFDGISVSSYAYKQMDSVLDSKINYYQSLYSLYNTHRDSIIEQRTKEVVLKDINDDLSLYKNRRDKYNNWLSSLPTAVQKDAKLLAITENLILPGYYGTCDYHLKFINFSNKTIKYLSWSGKVKNAVGDYVSCTIHHTTTISGRYTGPCEPLEIARPVWDGIFFNASAREVVLTSVIITYMDGSTRTIGKQSLDYISSIPPEVLDNIDILNRQYRMHSIYEDESYKEKKIIDDIPRNRERMKIQIGLDQVHINDTLRSYNEARKIIEENRFDIARMKSHLSQKKLLLLFDDPIFKDAADAYLNNARTDSLFNKVVEFRKNNFFD